MPIRIHKVVEQSKFERAFCVDKIYISLAGHLNTSPLNPLHTCRALRHVVFQCPVAADDSIATSYFFHVNGSIFLVDISASPFNSFLKALEGGGKQ